MQVSSSSSTLVSSIPATLNPSAPSSGMNSVRYRCVMNNGVTESCNITDLFAVLPDNITNQSPRDRLSENGLPVQFQSLASRVHLKIEKIEEMYRRFRQEEMNDFQKVEQIISSLKTVKDKDLPHALIPIINSAEESYARHFELGIALEEEYTQINEVIETRSNEIKNALQSIKDDNYDEWSILGREQAELKQFQYYWNKYRPERYITQIFRWLDNRTLQWNYAFGHFGYQYILPKVRNIDSYFSDFWHGATKGITQGDYFTPSNLTQRIGEAIGSTAIGFTPAGIAADIRDLTTAVKAMRSKGFSWATGSGVLLAGIGLIPGAGDAAKALGKLVKGSLAASRKAGKKGKFVQVAEAMKKRAEKYQTKITGLPAKHAYELNGVKFDGFKKGILLEAKGPGYANFVKYGEFADWWKNGVDRLLDQATRQLDAANGTRIQWHFAEESAAKATRALFKEKEIEGIEIIVTP